MAAATNSGEPDHTFDADLDFKEDFTRGMLQMLSQGSSNDVRIILRDGEISANKDVLAAQCEYFAANFRWKEKTKDGSDFIEITDCSKEVMERILQYLFTGYIKFRDLNLLQLLELVNQVRKLLLRSYLQDPIVTSIAEYVSIKIKYRPSQNILPDSSNIIDGLLYADKFVIDDVKSILLKGILVLLPSIVQDSEATSAFASLPLHLVKEIFSFILQKKEPSMNQILKGVCNSSQFKCLLAWLVQTIQGCVSGREKEAFGNYRFGFIHRN